MAGRSFDFLKNIFNNSFSTNKYTQEEKIATKCPPGFYHFA